MGSDKATRSLDSALLESEMPPPATPLRTRPGTVTAHGMANQATCSGCMRPEWPDRQSTDENLTAYPDANRGGALHPG